jgi:hypothetical protein
LKKREEGKEVSINLTIQIRQLLEVVEMEAIKINKKETSKDKLMRPL